MAEMRADATARPALGDWLAPLVAALVTAVALMNGSLLLGDPDIQWHLAAGRWIAEHRFGVQSARETLAAMGHVALSVRSPGLL